MTKDIDTPSIRILDEQMVLLSNLPGFPDGSRPHINTYRRWANEGIAGGTIKLETVKIGGRLWTSLEAWERFIAAASSQNGRDDLERQTPTSRKAQVAQANATLEKEWS